MTVEVFKATDGHAPNMNIVANRSMDDAPAPRLLGDDHQRWEEERRQFFAAQAKIIADAFWESLPGGTIDALLVELLDRKRCVLGVRMK